MKDTFLSFLIVAVIALIIGYKLFTGIMNTNEAMIADQEIAASTTEVTTSSITETTTQKHRESTTETTTSYYLSIKNEANNNFNSAVENIRQAYDELLSSADNGNTEIYKAANSIVNNTNIYPDVKYKEIGGLYYDLIDRCGSLLYFASQNIIHLYETRSNDSNYLVSITDDLTELNYALSLINETRDLWLQDSEALTRNK